MRSFIPHTVWMCIWWSQSSTSPVVLQKATPPWGSGAPACALENLPGFAALALDLDVCLFGIWREADSFTDVVIYSLLALLNNFARAAHYLFILSVYY